MNAHHLSHPSSPARVRLLRAGLLCGVLMAGLGPGAQAQTPPAARAAVPAPAGPLVPVQSGPRALPGTAWNIDFGKGVTGTLFLFCRGGARWEIVPARARSIGAVGKSYRVAGSTLTTVNADDGMTQKWAMAWAGDVLVINDGSQALRLHYGGQTQCQ